MKINTKNKLLFLGIVLLLFVSYKLAISKTFLLQSESKSLEAQVVQFQDMPKQLSLLNQKEQYYDSILRHMNLMDTSVQNNLLRILNKQAHKNKVKVMDFNKPHVLQIGENDYFTFSFDLNGNYTDILKVIHTIEQKGSFGEIVHTNFEKKKDYRTGKYSLGATVLIQQVK
ncbi:MAG: hypothetical protein AAFX53_06290 [Bacteroidota bacterium]